MDDHELREKIAAIVDEALVALRQAIDNVNARVDAVQERLDDRAHRGERGDDEVVDGEVEAEDDGPPQATQLPA